MGGVNPSTRSFLNSVEKSRKNFIEVKTEGVNGDYESAGGSSSWHRVAVRLKKKEFLTWFGGYTQTKDGEIPRNKVRRVDEGDNLEGKEVVGRGVSSGGLDLASEEGKKPRGVIMETKKKKKKKTTQEKKNFNSADRGVLRGPSCKVASF